MKRYNIYQVHDGWDYEEDDNGEWCKADEVIQEQQEMAAELAVSQLRIAELEAQLKVRNATVAPAVVRPDFHIEEDYE